MHLKNKNTDTNKLSKNLNSSLVLNQFIPKMKQETISKKSEKRFNDANHVCTAYVCGENNMIQRSSDNKEPAGTAGVPMLEAILKSDIQDVCACCNRYFGGIS